MIRLAVRGDIGGIMAVVEESREIMQMDGNFQWDEKYPTRRHFEQDIDNGNLYIIDEGGVVAGLMCLDSNEPEEYSQVSWQGGERAILIHRMAVSPRFRGRGNADALMDFARGKAEEQGVSSLKTDTFSKNMPMNALLLKHGFHKTGEIEIAWRKLQPFYCYEKIL